MQLNWENGCTHRTGYTDRLTATRRFSFTTQHDTLLLNNLLNERHRVDTRLIRLSSSSLLNEILLWYEWCTHRTACAQYRLCFLLFLLRFGVGRGGDEGGYHVPDEVRFQSCYFSVANKLIDRLGTWDLGLGTALWGEYGVRVRAQLELRLVWNESKACQNLFRGFALACDSE